MPEATLNESFIREWVGEAHPTAQGRLISKIPAFSPHPPFLNRKERKERKEDPFVCDTQRSIATSLRSWRS